MGSRMETPDSGVLISYGLDRTVWILYQRAVVLRAVVWTSSERPYSNSCQAYCRDCRDSLIV